MQFCQNKSDVKSRQKIELENNWNFDYLVSLLFWHIWIFALENISINSDANEMEGMNENVFWDSDIGVLEIFYFKLTKLKVIFNFLND